MAMYSGVHSGMHFASVGGRGAGTVLAAAPGKAVAAAPPGKAVNGTELGVLAFFFVAVAVLGFLAARWRRAGVDRKHLESGASAAAASAGSSPGSCSAATCTRRTRSSPCRRRCSAPGSVAASSPCRTRSWSARSSSSSWPRLWSVSRRHGYVTPADFVRGRYGSRALSLAVAVTGILATMPYIALQLVGIQAVLDVIGIGGTGTRSPRTCRCSSRSRCLRRTRIPRACALPHSSRS